MGLLRLDIAEGPFWVALSCGVQLHCEPCNSTLYEAMQQKALAAVDEALKQGTALEDLGATLEGLPDLESEAGRTAAIRVLTALYLAEEVVQGWSGVGTAEGKPAPFRRADLKRLFALPGVPGDFSLGYLATWLLVRTEGNA